MKFLLQALFVLSSLMIVFSSHAETDGKSQYTESYAKHVRNGKKLMARGLEQRGLTSEQADKQAGVLVEKIINCHLNYIDSYPKQVKEVMFKKIASGGSYPDAESEAKKIVAEAELTGNKALVSQFIAATEQSVNCIKR